MPPLGSVRANNAVREVCAIKRLTNKVENITTITDTIPIAGEFSHSIGGALDPRWERLKGSASSADREKEGIRLIMNGGKYEKKKQQAIVEFVCNAKSEERTRNSVAAAEEDNEDGEEVDDEHGGKLKLLSWEDEDDIKVLRLEWQTKYGCEDAEEGNGSSSGHWGFFTWFILMWVLSNPRSTGAFADGIFLQCVHGSRSVSHLRFVAQL